MHSQSVKKTPARPWVLAQRDGQMKIRDAKTVTQEKAYWLLPAAVRDVQYAPVSEIDFTSAKTKRARLEKAIESTESGEFAPLVTSTPQRKAPRHVPSLADEERQEFLRKLMSVVPNAAVLTISPGFSQYFTPSITRPEAPEPLTNLYSDGCHEMSRSELRAYADGLDISITPEQAKWIEEHTRKQANSKLWFQYRAGRITASRMKAACRTSTEKPSPSLIRAICHPESVKFRSAATTWGCTHEKTALEDYKAAAIHTHDSLVISESGLVVNPDYPEIGASPDAFLAVPIMP